jgi:hypothetical protein
VTASVQDIHNFLRDHHSNPTSLMPGAIRNEVIKNYNDNLSAFYAVCKSGALMKNREYVNLKYYEILPEDKFAISCCIAIDEGEIMKLVPIGEKVVRGEVSKCFCCCDANNEIVAGNVLRGTNDINKTTLVTIIHLDLRGNSSAIPTFAFKRQIIKQTTAWSVMLNAHFKNCV